MKKITGSIVALVTPFNADGSVDHGRLREIVEWHVQNKTDAILALGTTGETASTTLEEDIKTLKGKRDTLKTKVKLDITKIILHEGHYAPSCRNHFLQKDYYVYK